MFKITIGTSLSTKLKFFYLYPSEENCFGIIIAHHHNHKYLNKSQLNIYTFIFEKFQL